MLSHDTFLEIASRYPPEVAAKLARTLREGGQPSEIDVRMAQQLTLDDVLNGDAVAPDELPDYVVAMVIDKRARRRERLAAREAERARRELDAATRQHREEVVRREAAEAAARQQAEREAMARDRREAALRNEVDAATRAQRAAEEASAKAERARRTTRIRATVAAVAAAMAVVAVTLLIVTELQALALATGLSAVLVLYFGWTGAEDPPFPWGKVLLGVTVELLGLLDLIR